MTGSGLAVEVNSVLPLEPRPVMRAEVEAEKVANPIFLHKLHSGNDLIRF